MNKMTASLKKIRPLNFIILTIAGIINAVGVTIFLIPVGIYDGGFSGTSFFLSQVTPLNLSIFLLILNSPFFVLGFKKLGFSFIVYSLYTIGVYSLFAYLFQSVFPIDWTGGSPVAGNDLLLCALFGGAISGIGSGLTIRFGGAIDGVEVTAVLYAKKIGLSVGAFVMIYNTLLYVITGFVVGNWTIPLYSIVAYAVGLKAVDFVVDGFDKAKSAIIITDKYEELAEALLLEFGRGVTAIKAEGYYSKTSKTVLYCVVNRFEVAKLKTLVMKLDTNAFVAINDVSDSMGKRLKFERFSKKVDLVSENIAESVSENIAESVSENIVESVSENIVESVSENIVES